MSRHENVPALVYAEVNGEMQMVDIIPCELVPKTKEGIEALIKYEKACNGGTEILISQGKTPLGSDMS